MKFTINCKLSNSLKLFFLVATIAFQACSPGETYNSSKNLLTQSGSSTGIGDVINPNPIIPVNGASCSWQWADDFAPVTPINLRPPLKSMSCTQANQGQKQNVIDSSADWTCLCQNVVTPTPSPTPGATPTPTPTPTPPPAAAGVDLCPSIPVHYNMNASAQHIRMCSGNYAYLDVGIALNSPSSPVMMAGSHMIIKLNDAAGDTTFGRFPVGFEYSDVGPTRGGRHVTISKTKCDYSANAIWISPSPFLSSRFEFGANSGAVSLLINESKAVDPGTNEQKIDTGTWYINIQDPPGSCPVGISCDVVTEWSN